MPTYNPNEAKELVETLQKQAVAWRIKSPAFGAALAMVAVGWWKLGYDNRLIFYG